jgi:hypothetical protein
VLAGLVVRLALCCAITWWAWRRLGLIALPLCAPLFGVAAAGPIMTLAAGSWTGLSQAAREAAWHARLPYQGRRIRYFVDAAAVHWFCVDDMRKLVPNLPPDRGLLALYPERCKPPNWRRPAYLRADAAQDLFAKATDRATIRFAHWLGGHR